MKWTRPQYEEKSLALEVKGYVDVDDARPAAAPAPEPEDGARAREDGRPAAPEPER